MRVVGIVLVVAGALSLAYAGFGAVAGGPAGDGVWAPPVVGGIAVVLGLLVLLTTRDEGPDGHPPGG